MKKVVYITLAIGLVVCGGIFAQTPKISLNARVSGSLGTVDLDNGENNKSINLGGVSNTDTFGIEITDKLAGAKVSLKGSDLIDSSSGGNIQVDDYYGWMKFGDLKLTAGEWDHRYVNRVTSDGSNFGGLWDLKYGIITRKSGSEGDITVAVNNETDNLTPWEIELAADYVKDALTVSFSTGNTNNNNTAYPNYKDYGVKDYFGIRSAYKVKDRADVSAAFTMNGKNIGNVGVFISPVFIKNLTLVAGYSGNYDFDVSENNKHAIEVRARYVIDKLSVTTHDNLTMGDKNMIIYDMLNVTYKINDIFVPSIMIANSNFSGDNAAWKGNVLTVRPAITLNAQKGASIDAGLRLKMTSPETGDDIKVMDFPVVFRIKF